MTEMERWLYETLLMCGVALTITALGCLWCWLQAKARNKYWIHYDRRSSKRSKK